MTDDYLVRATALEGRVRAFSLQASGVVAELQRRHGLYPVPTAAVGRLSMGALVLAAASLKDPDQLLSIEIRGDGPVGRILCTANGAGEVRAMVGNAHAHAESTAAGKLNVAGVVGTRGYLSVTRDLGMRDPYQGVVELQSGEIGDDLAFYLGRSEQTPSAVGLGVFVRSDGSVEAAGGYLIQLLPGLAEEEIIEIESQIAALPHPTSLLRAGLRPEAVLEKIFGSRLEVFGRQEVRFGCPCSRERFEAALITLGAEELERLVHEEGEEVMELVCHFCNEQYHFTAAEMEQVLRSALS